METENSKYQEAIAAAEKRCLEQTGMTLAEYEDAKKASSSQRQEEYRAQLRSLKKPGR